MAMSRSATAWVVSGAIGLTSFTLGTIASQGSGQAVPEQRPAVSVPASAVPTGSSSATTKPTVKPSDDDTAKPTTKPTKKATTGPSAVSPPSAETPD